MEKPRGSFTIEVHPDWAPNGAQRFKELVEGKVFDDMRIFRAIKGFMAQMGIPGVPAEAAKWRSKKIPDDPRRKDVSNKKGFVTFATSGPNSRTSQFFINFKDNSFLDGQGFPPIGRVVESDMAVIDTIYKGYGEGAPNGRGPGQGQIQSEGNGYLDKYFQKLTSVSTARIVEGSGLLEESDKSTSGGGSGGGRAAAAAEVLATDNAGSGSAIATPAPAMPFSVKVELERPKGVFTIEVNPAWAPLGAKRFKKLVERGVLDGIRIFRAVRRRGAHRVCVCVCVSPCVLCVCSHVVRVLWCVWCALLASPNHLGGETYDPHSRTGPFLRSVVTVSCCRMCGVRCHRCHIAI
jgi:peptidyl-prolyl cis-trans isomerase A (cyclophilin A)